MASWSWSLWQLQLNQALEVHQAEHWGVGFKVEGHDLRHEVAFARDNQFTQIYFSSCVKGAVAFLCHQGLFLAALRGWGAAALNGQSPSGRCLQIEATLAL